MYSLPLKFRKVCGIPDVLAASVMLYYAQCHRNRLHSLIALTHPLFKRNWTSPTLKDNPFTWSKFCDPHDCGLILFTGNRALDMTASDSWHGAAVTTGTGLWSTGGPQSIDCLRLHSYKRLYRTLPQFRQTWYYEYSISSFSDSFHLKAKGVTPKLLISCNAE